MELELIEKFIKKYQDKPQDKRRKVEKTLSILETDPRHPGLHTHKVQGKLNIFECYIDDSYRVTFQYGEDCILLRNCCKHNAVLRRP